MAYIRQMHYVVTFIGEKEELPVVAMLITDRDEMYNLYRGPSIDASYQVSAKRF